MSIEFAERLLSVYVPCRIEEWQKKEVEEKDFGAEEVDNGKKDFNEN